MPVAPAAPEPAGDNADDTICEPAEYRRLTDIKNRVDPGRGYIGHSVAVLRAFEAVDRFNRREHHPVVVCGPSRVGKTAIARLIHTSSGSSGRPFLRLSASSVLATDAGLRLSRWVGVGPNSLIAGARPGTQTRGWLQEAAGGTIFIDELQDLDLETQQFLRQVFDRTPIPLAAGDGPPVTSDVRLVFATNRPLEELVGEGRLRQDFVNRLRDRVVDIPPLDRRREDIPLFVRRHGDGLRPTMKFHLCLLRHPWGAGQVESLVHAIETAVDACRPGPLTPTGLREVREMGPTVQSVIHLSEDGAADEVFGLLESVLTAQEGRPVNGSGRGGVRGRGLGWGQGRRLADLLGVSPAIICRRFRRRGSGQQPVW